jgi:hypothetical protein
MLAGPRRVRVLQLRGFLRVPCVRKPIRTFRHPQGGNRWVRRFLRRDAFGWRVSCESRGLPVIV